MNAAVMLWNACSVALVTSSTTSARGATGQHQNIPVAEVDDGPQVTALRILDHPDPGAQLLEVKAEVGGDEAGETPTGEDDPLGRVCEEPHG
jgi:hypothetical protein